MNKKLKSKYKFFFSINLIILFFFESITINYKKEKNPTNLNSKLNLANEMIKIYSTLYDIGRDGKAIGPQFSNSSNVKNYLIKRNKGICICMIGKKENLYARQFVEYYKKIKIDKIVIFDNNDLDGEIFYDVLKDYVNKKFVDIIDVRGLNSALYAVYNYCYKLNKDLYDWIAFLDFDEYIFVENYTNFNDYIYNIRFKNCQTIFFNWKFYNDNDLVNYDNRTLMERFQNALTFSFQGKSFVRGGIDNLIMLSSMIPGINIDYYFNANGERIFPINFFNANNKNYELIGYLKHFYTKTAEEFCNKINKGDGQFHKNHYKYLPHIKFKISFFFTLNKITNKKIKILEKCLGINLNNYKNKIKE